LSVSRDTENSAPTTRWWDVAPLLGLIGVVPLIVYLQVIPLNATQTAFWDGTNVNSDFYSYYKACWICIFSFVGFLLFLGSRKPRENRYHVHLALFSLLAIVSTVFSEYQVHSLIGSMDRHEGLLVLLSYFSATFMAMHLIEDDRWLKILLIVLMISGFIVAMVGAFQFFDLDFFSSDLGKQLTFPERFHHLIPLFGMNSEAGSVHSTFPNSNYVGSYIPMVFLLSWSLLLFGGGKVNLVLVPLNLLLFINWIGCRSKAGLLGGAIGLLVLFLLCRKRLFSKASTVAFLIAAYLFVAFAMDYFTLKHPQVLRLFDMFSEQAITHELKAPLRLEDIQLASDSVQVFTKSGRIKVELRDKEFTFINRQDLPVPFKYRKNRVIFPESEFREFDVKADPAKKLLQIKVDWNVLTFMKTDEGFRVLDGLGRPDTFRKVETWGFEGSERWGNGRGYVWSRSFPLLKGTILSGFGPDTFLYYFPQHDYLGRLRSGYPIAMLSDKPHDMYLQTAINTGILSLFISIALFWGYLSDSLQLLRRSEFTCFSEQVGAGITAAILSYLITGIFNDSTVAVAPVFWVLLGTGIGINQRLMERAEIGNRSST